MKVQLLTSNNDDGDREDAVIVDGKRLLKITPLYECPEDATLDRNMINGREVIEYIQLGYNAAKRGEDFEILPDGELVD